MPDPLIPATVIGSWSFPGWYEAFIADVVAHPGRFGLADREEALRDAVRVVVDDQRRAGLDRITDGEILGLANSRTVSSDVLRYIYSNREFTRTYAIKISLVKNPKVPLPTALRMMYTLQEKDIKELARDRNVPQTIQAQAKAFMMKKEAAARGPAMGKH